MAATGFRALLRRAAVAVPVVAAGAGALGAAWAWPGAHQPAAAEAAAAPVPSAVVVETPADDQAHAFLASLPATTVLPPLQASASAIAKAPATTIVLSDHAAPVRTAPYGTVPSD
jgi:hypothetical protein